MNAEIDVWNFFKIIAFDKAYLVHANHLSGFVNSFLNNSTEKQANPYCRFSSSLITEVLLELLNSSTIAPLRRTKTRIKRGKALVY
jgi:hypothetical protein